MEWMWAAVWVWIGWTIIAPFLMLVLVFIGIIIAGAIKEHRQARCPHERFYETRECDAVCAECGKNLGFIGTVRDQRKALSR